ncbi:unnamed protein product [Alopecurus aequalis]
MEEDQRLLERILDRKEEPTDLSLALLQKITNDFSKERKIGQGGFGAVYKGVLGERIVAVKKIYVNLDKIDDDDKQFGREIKLLWNTDHPNVVRFLGFCSNIHQKRIQKDGSRETIMANVRQRLFCFEYIRNGTLDKHITDELRGLEWKTRYEIITGICEGLRYLHEEKEFIHMDLKPANILLDHQDEKYIPKIADFGLSRPNKDSHTVGRCYGTLGYWAPENMEFSKTIPQCDIYSLGAIIMELVTGGIEVADKHNVLRRWRSRRKNPPTPLQYHQIIGCIDIAVRCRKQNPEARPSINEIIKSLNESTNVQTDQESTNMEDDMLGIEPLELDFNKEMSWSVKLTNKTNAYFAFKIERPSNQYTIRPDIGIVPPKCDKYPVQITLQPQERASQVIHIGDKFIVQSTKVSEGHVSKHTFRVEADKVTDEVGLMVVYKTAQELSPKAIVSSSYEDGARRQLDRRNFHPPENFSNSRATNLTYLVRVSDRTMDVTRGAIGSLLHKLGVLHKDFNLEMSVKKHADELVKMHQVLCKLSDVQQANLDDRVKLWASNVRDMSYDLEDFVDGFLVHIDPTSDASSFRDLRHEIYLEKGKSHQPIPDLIKLHIGKQVQDLAEKCKEYNVDNTIANATTKADIEDPRFSNIYIDREQLIGIEGPKKELTTLLDVDGHVSRLKIVSIVGLGGLGKTTLAQEVYGKLQAQYHTRAFVPVGQNPDVKDVLKNIINELDNNFKEEILGMMNLRKKLKDFLHNKRYFIVIDDIWDSSEWNCIRHAFPENENGSRLMITTRNHDVALACCNFEKKMFMGSKNSAT